MTLCFKNPSLGNIPDYWNIPLTSYNNEVCFVTSDSVVAAPKLLLRTIFPEFNDWLCEGCVGSHERVTVIVKDVHSDQLEEAFRQLALGSVNMLAQIIELSPITSNEDAAVVDKSHDVPEETDEIKVKQEPSDDDVGDQGIKTENEVDKDASTKKRLIFCELCDLIAENMTMLKEHTLAKHSDTSKLKFCEFDDCDFSTKSKQDLKKHDITAHVDWLACKFCSFTSRFKAAIKKHVKNIHPEKKKYNCSYCIFSTNNKVKFEIHEKVHLKFQCPVCNKQFKGQKCFERHVAGGHEEIACPNCDSKFPTNKLLKEHFKEAHLDKGDTELRQCKYCPYRMKLNSNHEKYCMFKDKEQRENKKGLFGDLEI